ncbi:MAG: GNAT family N-acetyltransferase [Candidatus Izemoplasmatales bacterium]
MNPICLKNGKYLYIRRPIPDDACAILAYLKQIGSESGNLTFGPEGIALTVEQEKEFIIKNELSKTSVIYLGFVDGQIVANASLSAPDRERIKHTSVFGISVMKSYWNQGVATAMIKEIIAFAKATTVIKIIHLAVRADNINAIHLYETHGFKSIGVYSKQMYVDGRYFDTILMNLEIF